MVGEPAKPTGLIVSPENNYKGLVGEPGKPTRFDCDPWKNNHAVILVIIVEIPKERLGEWM